MNRRLALMGTLMSLLMIVGAAWAEDQPATPPEPVISMDYKDANLKDVLKLLSQQAQLNFIAAKDVEDLPITLYLEKVPVEAAINQLMQANDLSYELDPVSRIFLVRTVAKKAVAPAEPAMETRIYKLRYARVSGLALEKVSQAFAATTPFEASKASSSSSGGGGGGGGGGAGGAEEGGGVEKIIENLLSKGGMVAGDARTNRLIVTDTPANLTRIEQTIQELDLPARQVLIEVEVLETSADFLKGLGIEYGDTNGTLATLTGGSRATSFPFHIDSLNDIFFRMNTPDAVTKGSFAALNTSAILKAIESDSHTKILARPKLMMLDNESAMIKLARDEAIAVTRTTDTGTANSVTSDTVERTPTGVILSVTPQINDDRFITLLIEPNVSKTVTSSLVANGQPVLDPKTRSTRTMVRVGDSETIMIGGLLDSSDTETVRKVPVLGNIPLLGLAFQKQDVRKISTELVVFLTPHIVKEPTETASLAGSDAGYEQAGGSAVPREGSMEQLLNRFEGQ